VSLLPKEELNRGEVTGLLINIVELREFRARKIRMTKRGEEVRK
jgi:hypothetical protein